MNQTEDEDHPDETGGTGVEVTLEPAQVVEGLVADGQRDHRINQIVVDRDAVEGREDQRDRMADSKGGDELDDVVEARQEEDHAEQEQQVVVASEHVRSPKLNVLQVAGVDDALHISGRHAVAHGIRRQQKERGEGEQVFTHAVLSSLCNL